jgi:Family of unknown function (DUF6789)
MREAHVSRALLGGFFATLAMTVLMYAAPTVGAPRMDIAAALGALFGHGVPAQLSALWWAGMVWHFLNGTVIFALLYAYFVYGWLSGEGWLRGMIWGLMLWLTTEVVVMPIAGNGLFSDHSPEATARVAGAFILHAVYGSVLGWSAGPQAEHFHHAERHA